MKTCPKCGELLGDMVEVCFRCRYSYKEKRVITGEEQQRKREEQQRKREEQKEQRELRKAQKDGDCIRFLQMKLEKLQQQLG